MDLQVNTHDRLDMLLADCAKLDSDGLKQLFMAGLGMTAAGFLQAAAALRAEIDAGREITWARDAVGPSLLEHLKRLAYKELDAELFLTCFLEKRKHFRILEKLPVHAQKSLMLHKTVPLVLKKADGTFDRVLADVTEMKVEELGRVFVNGVQQSESQQRRAIEEAAVAQVARAPERIGGQFDIDHERKLVHYIGKRGEPISEATIAAVYRALRS